MEYKFENIRGVPLSTSFRAFRRVVNNGCTIETNDDLLFKQLELDENDRKGNPIDWQFFKTDKTVLIDNLGRKFACTSKSSGYINLIHMLSNIDCHMRNFNDMKEYLNFLGLDGENICRKAKLALIEMETIYIPEIKRSLYWIYSGEKPWNIDGKENSDDVNDYRWHLL